MNRKEKIYKKANKVKKFLFAATLHHVWDVGNETNRARKFLRDFLFLAKILNETNKWLIAIICLTIV